MDVEKTIEFLLSNQAKLDARQAEFIERQLKSDKQSDERLTRLESVVSSLAGSVDKLADNIERLDEAMVSLAGSEERTNQRIDQLGVRVDQFVGAVSAILRHLPPAPNPT